MHPVIGRVEIQNQFAGSRRKRRDEFFHQHLVQREGRPPVHPVFQPAQRRAGGQFLVALQRRLPGQVQPQRPVIVEVLVTEGQTVNALAQQIDLPVRNEIRVARSGANYSYLCLSCVT
jgi:hypothetical protein